MPRRAAAGHNRSMQPWKPAAAVRIASALISGWPEEPDSPLHCGTGCAAGGSEPVVVTELRLSRMPCADTAQQVAVMIPTAMRIGRARIIPIPIQPPDLWVPRYHFSLVNGVLFP